MQTEEKESRLHCEKSCEQLIRILNESVDVGLDVGKAGAGVVASHRFAVAVDEELFEIPAHVVHAKRAVVESARRREKVARGRASFLSIDRKRQRVNQLNRVTHGSLTFRNV